MIMAVTGYVPIENHPRSMDEYVQLGEQLNATGIPLLALSGKLEDCWMYHYLSYRKAQHPTHSTADNPRKNTIAYHIVQAQKSEWLTVAADLNPVPDVFVWLDMGIFHIPGMTAQIVRDFMFRAENERTIAIPGCWDRNYEYDDRYPMWRWAGGVMIVPRQYVDAFDACMKDEYKRHLRETNNLSWEVNTLSRLERRGTALPLWHYRANHDASMLTNYRETEYADVKRSCQ
jgi:hypothetical protein